MKLRLSILSVLAVCLAGAPAAQAVPILYKATLSGPNEAPPNASPGTGSALVLYDAVMHTLQVNATFQDLTSNTSASHIHCCTAAPGAGTAGVATQIPTFPGFPLGVTSGTYNSAVFDLTLASSWNPAFITANGGTPASAEAIFAAGLAGGKTYFNVHTTAFPGGEIRGFLVPEPATLWLLTLGAAAVVQRRRRRI